MVYFVVEGYNPQDFSFLTAVRISTTCKQYGINFKEYITHVVKEIINGNTNYETLVPWAIKLA